MDFKFDLVGLKIEATFNNNTLFVLDTSITKNDCSSKLYETLEEVLPVLEMFTLNKIVIDNNIFGMIPFDLDVEKDLIQPIYYNLFRNPIAALEIAKLNDSSIETIQEHPDGSFNTTNNDDGWVVYEDEELISLAKEEKASIIDIGYEYLDIFTIEKYITMKDVIKTINEEKELSLNPKDFKDIHELDNYTQDKEIFLSQNDLINFLYDYYLIDIEKYIDDEFPSVYDALDYVSEFYDFEKEITNISLCNINVERLFIFKLRD